MDKKVIFESERIKFVNVSKGLTNDYLKMLGDEDTSRYLSLKKIEYSYEAELKWIEEKLNNNDIIFSMIEKASNEFIGNIELKSDSGENEIGIVITKKMQDKHFGTEALTAFIDYLFNTLNLDRVMLKVFSENKKAIECYKYIGFKEYKIDKNIGIIDGKEVDDIYMEIKK